MKYIKLLNKKVFFDRNADYYFFKFRKLLKRGDKITSPIKVIDNKILETKLSLSSEAVVALYFYLKDTLTLEDIAKFEKSHGKKVLITKDCVCKLVEKGKLDSGWCEEHKINWG